MNIQTEKPLVEINCIKKQFPIYGGFFRRVVGNVKAIDNVSLSIAKGETLGLVGESGCGKSTLGRCMLRLIPLTNGEILYHGDGWDKNIANLTKEESFDFSKKMQIVFQDPYSAINPVKTVFDSFDEPLRVHGMKNLGERKELIAHLMELVNLLPDYMYRYPHEFSGGQRQRICIARALCMKPDMLVLDEPVSALDVSIQAQVLNLLQDIQKDRNLTYLFIAHDLSVVEYMSDRIAVMYLGKIVELAESKELYNNPRHPYTQALLSAVPIPVVDNTRKRIILKGDVPSPANPPKGCSFHTRCQRCQEKCGIEEPSLTVDDNGHYVSCHYPD